MSTLESFGLYFAADGYIEPPPPRPNQPAPQNQQQTALGLMGRHVAGAEFLDAYLQFGEAKRIVPLVPNRAAMQAFESVWNAHPGVKAKSRSSLFIGTGLFHRRFFPNPPTRLLHIANPLDASYAWARQANGPHSFALSGITHTICTPMPVQAFAQMLTAPFEPYDALICTSEAARKAVLRLTESYANFLRERHGGNPTLGVRLPVIPFGVNPQKFRPATAEERVRRRADLKIADDEVVVLFVGRLSFHAKANPYPMYHGLYHAARATGKNVRLILSGWAANEQIHRAFLDAARVFAPIVNTTHVDSLAPAMRTGIWHVGDIFTSLSDNFQESQGLTILQAMACGLPVVGTDWDGYRDMVVQNETGILIPTTLIPDAATDLTSRLLTSELNVDMFLSATSQTVVVDCAQAVKAYTRLLSNPDLRRQMGDAGRRRILDRFIWEKTIAAYDTLWKEQEVERASRAKAGNAAPTANRGPSLYPVPEASFADYPTRIAADADLVQASPENDTRLLRLLKVAVTSYSPESRSTDPIILGTVLKAATRPVALRELDDVFRKAGVARQIARATLAWMLKYALLEFVTPAGA